MRNLTDVFLETAPSRFKLPFGVSKNVVLKAVDNEVRRDKNGVKINKNCYMTFAAVDVENNDKSIAETTFSYFNIDKPTYAVKGFQHQYNQMAEILKAVVPKAELNRAASFISKVVKEYASIFASVQANTVPDAKTTKAIGECQVAVTNAFIKAISPYTNENGDKVNLLVVTDAKGQFLDLPREDKGFISKMDGGRALTVDAKYARWYANKDVAEKAKKDDIGSEDDIVGEEDILTEEEQQLDL